MPQTPPKMEMASISSLLRLLLISSFVATWASYECDAEIQEILPPELAHPVALHGCDNDFDLLEMVLDVRDAMDGAEPVHRRYLQQEDWFQRLQLLNAMLVAPAVTSGARPSYGLDEYQSTVASYVAEGEEGDLPPAEVEALRRLGHSLLCSSTFVGCSMVGIQLRVTALVQVLLQAADAPEFGSSLAALSELKALRLRVTAEQFHEVRMLHLPKLEILELQAGADVHFEYQDPALEHFGLIMEEVLSRHRALRVVSVIPSKYAVFNFNLSKVCGLQELRDLQLADMNIRLVPPCLGQLKELRNVYLSCNFLTGPPVGLQDMPELRSFVAFRQGEWTPCHFQGRRNSVLLEEKFERCRAIWESKVGHDDLDNARVVCPGTSLHASVRDFMELGWSKLEKLWLDGGFLQGEIPEDLPTYWPKLSSLDLYSNQLSGPLPPSLATLKLHKLQLQDNAFAGTVPAELLRQPICAFNIAANAGLTGCIYPPWPFPDDFELDRFPGTEVVTCQEAAAARSSEL